MAILLDGKKLAEKITTELKTTITEHGKKLSLAVIRVGSDPVIAKFVEQKKRLAGNLGVDFRIYNYEASISTNELRKRISVIVHEADPDGVIIQLPLPAPVNTQYILNSIPPEKDVDVLSARSLGNFSTGKTEIFPPVVAAIKVLFEEYGIDYRTKHAVVVGAGMLVGKPVAAWLLNEKVPFSIVDEHTPDISVFTKQADIIVSGVGKPGLITGDIVKEGVVVIDAGTSESNGKLAGDADFESVSKKASYITSVPGGVGPLTVVMIYKNLLAFAEKRR